MDPTYPLFPIFSFIGFILALIPLPWHTQALNSGTCLFMIWTAIGCLNQFVNSIVWYGTIVDKAPVFCDISTRIMVGISVAIPAASLCINRRLYKIATCQTATITHSQKKRAVIVDLSIGLGIPILQMVLQYIVQGHRYDLWEDIGCLPTTVNTPPAYPLSFLWPNIISIISGVYCVLTLRAFMLRRAQFTQFLSSNTSLSVNRYFRLMCLATTEIIFTIPISSFGLYLNISSKPIYPWTSWSDTHYQFSIIDVIPASVWRQSRLFTVILEVNRWQLVFCAVVFFAFFGFAEEARKSYYSLYWAIVSRFGIIRPTKQRHSAPKMAVLPSKNTSDILPTFVHPSSPPSYTKRDSSQSTTSLVTHKSSVYTDTLYASPTTPNEKFDLEFPCSPTSSRMSRITI